MRRTTSAAFRTLSMACPGAPDRHANAGRIRDHRIVLVQVAGFQQPAPTHGCMSIAVSSPAGSPTSWLPVRIGRACRLAFMTWRPDSLCRREAIWDAVIHPLGVSSRRGRQSGSHNTP